MEQVWSTSLSSEAVPDTTLPSCERTRSRLPRCADAPTDRWPENRFQVSPGREEYPAATARRALNHDRLRATRCKHIQNPV